MKTFHKPFTQQEAIPEAGIARAVELLRSGRLHRYNLLADETSEVSLLEQEFAQWLGVKHCLACASGGYALHIALKAAGLQAGEPVLTNAYTLAPVPGAIDNAGGHIVLVEVDENYRVDLAHLKTMITKTNARFFMLSHMRGHIADMEALMQICDAHAVMVIEDCAHTMGASWQGQASGTFGKVACFSTQTYKHLNSGEGGFLTSNDPEIMARAIMHSGSYMLYERNGTAPDAEVFANIRLQTPNYSGRMDALRAAILRAQLPHLEENCRRWNRRYQALEQSLGHIAGVILPVRPPQETYVGSSLQFRIPSLNESQISPFISTCAQRGVELKWFGSANPHGFTSRYDSWHYMKDTPVLEQTLAILKHTFDLRIPLTFAASDMPLIGDIIGEVLAEIQTGVRTEAQTALQT